MPFQVLGIKGDAGFDRIIEHFHGLGGDAVLLNPTKIVGADHLSSAGVHAQRAFANGTNRSDSFLTEVILYAAFERQIGKALNKMRPEKDAREFAVLLIDIDDPQLDRIGMERDDSILDESEEKARSLGLEDPFLGPCERALEAVAMLDLQKQ